MWQSLPELGTGVLYAILVAAAYTIGVSLVAGTTRRPRFLEAARLGALGTVALVCVATLMLAYAFVTHDYRIRYVARYSDRSMPLPYLFAALWGGQDGSLLWWAFLLSLYTGACVVWIKGKYRELAPWVIATLMSIMTFFMVLMLFAANPFWTSVAGARPDGEGLNPLLQNFYMAIHPPSLYTGFVGCAVPFSFSIAALITGRLDNEWVVASRKWMLFAWMFLSIGNALGMIWAYEELGWGGYWAWDPVENAACLPWFTASAYLHSTMTQERRGMLKVWNVVLVMTTFLLTIFGTFLTRSGMIASVHSFAQSDIGKYFVGYMGVVIGACLGLIVWRLPRLRSEGRIESALSREATFVVNNWALLGMMTFILVATVFPKISELWGEQVTVGPPFFNRWLVPPGLAVFALMGAGPLFGWRKTSESALYKAFAIPLGVMGAMIVLHLSFGARLGFPAIVESPTIYPGILGTILQKIGAAVPLVGVALCAFNTAVIIQEFSRGAAARRRTNPEEGLFTAIVRLVAKSRRRYGGYVVHFGIVLMFLGFTGKSWDVDREASLSPGQSLNVAGYNIKYEGPRMEVDPSKRMVFADVTVSKLDGSKLGGLSPAKFIYRKMPESPTTEVAMMHSLRDDVYVVVGTVNPTSKVASFHFHVNALVSWIWFGVIVLVFGAVTAMWPDVSFAEAGVWGYARAFGAATFSVLLGVALAATPGRAYAQQSSSLHAGTVEMQTPAEREIFPMMLCQCGDCARLPLSNCVCNVAETERAAVRDQLAAGRTRDQILEGYVAKHGTGSLSVPPNTGKLRTIYLVPGAIAIFGAAGAFFMLRRWRSAGGGKSQLVPAGGPAPRDEYDTKLDEELDKLNG
jgi:cytochrome c-type biogenesis protein CcmF